VVRYSPRRDADDPATWAPQEIEAGAPLQKSLREQAVGVNDEYLVKIAERTY